MSMNKYWIYIIILLILGVSCLSLIVNNSDTVGSASQSVGHVIVSVPPDFSVYSSDSDSVSLVSSKGYKIAFSELQNGRSSEKSFNNRVDELNKTAGETILKKGVLNVSNIPVYTVFYHSDKNEEHNELNSSISYFEQYNHTYFLRIWGFNYVDDYDETIQYITIILGNMREDYKQNKN